MAKKKWEAEPTKTEPIEDEGANEQPTAAAVTGKKVKMSDAIRDGLKELGIDSSANDIGGWIKAKYPELTEKVEKKTFGQAVSNYKKPLKSGSPAARGTDSKPDGDDLLKAAEIVKEFGGLVKLKAALDFLEKLKSI